MTRHIGASGPRRHDLDRLRVAACLLLFPFHTAEVFDLQPAYHIKSATTVVALEYVTRAINAWHMPLFFVLAGMAAMMTLRANPSLIDFLVNRNRRLWPPLLIGLLTIAPATKYLERLGGRDMSYEGVELVPGWIAPSIGRFYVSFFSNLDSFSWTHLWFLAYLLVLLTVAAPVLGAMRTWGLTRALAPRILLWLPLGALLAIELILRPVWGDLHNFIGDWANIAGYLVVLLAGAALVRFPTLDYALARQWRQFAVVGVAGLVIMSLAWEGPVANIGRAMANWGTVAALIGARIGGMRAIWPHEAYFVKSQLWIYVLHHLPLLVLAYFLRDQPWPVALRFALIMTGAVVITFAFYHVVVRPVLMAKAPSKAKPAIR